MPPYASPRRLRQLHSRMGSRITMIDSLNWWLSLRRNANFWDWLKDTYSIEELKGLASEATETNIIRPRDLLADQYFCNGRPLEEVVIETSRRLYKRYHLDIWHICLGAGLDRQGDEI